MYQMSLGFRSLLFRKKQYISLFLVCAFGVCVSVFCLFLIDGMLSALNMRAKLYYGGDLQFIGGTRNLYFADYKAEIEKLKEIFPEEAIITPRFDFDSRNAAIYFEGTGVRQRVVKGVDFEKEVESFKKVTFVSGSFEGMAGSNGILLSKPIAAMLEVKVGDMVTFMLRNSENYINTVLLEVKGIFTDSSVFGMYTSYMDIDVLRNAYGMDSNACNRITICFPEQAPSQKEINYYQRELEKKYNMFPLTSDKQIFYEKLFSMQAEQGPIHALIQLSANLQEVKIVIDAMYFISYLVIAILILIVVIGISSTYRVLVMKRTDEIGIYMAIGMQRRGIREILLFETFFLLFFGCVSGIILSQFLCFLLRFIDFSFIPAFDIFLSNGNIVPIVTFNAIFSVCGIVIVTTAAAVLFAVQKVVKMTPCQALSFSA